MSETLRSLGDIVAGRYELKEIIGRPPRPPRHAEPEEAGETGA